MSGVDSLAAAIIRQSEPSTLAPVTVGTITRVDPSGEGFIVWVTGITPDVLTVPAASLSSVFIAEAQALGSALVGRRVVVLFASRQALIAYTLGV